LLGVVAALPRQCRQVAPGQVAVDPLVYARKLIGAPQPQDSSPAGLGAGVVAGLTTYNRLTEEQFRIIRIDRQPRRTRGDGLRRLSEHLMGSCNQGIELLRDRIGRR